MGITTYTDRVFNIICFGIAFPAIENYVEVRPGVSVDLDCRHMRRAVAALTPPPRQKYAIPEVNPVLLYIYYDRDTEGDL